MKISTQSVTESQRAKYYDHQPHNGKNEHIRPKGLESYGLEEDAANDNEKITDRKSVV